MDQQSTIGVKVRIDWEAGSINQVTDQMGQAIRQAGGSTDAEGRIASLVDQYAGGREQTARNLQSFYSGYMDSFSAQSIQGTKGFEKASELTEQLRELEDIGSTSSKEYLNLQNKAKRAWDNVFREIYEQRKKSIQENSALFGLGREGNKEAESFFIDELRGEYKAARGMNVPGVEQQGPQEPGFWDRIAGGRPRTVGERFTAWGIPAAMGVAGTGMHLYSQEQTLFGGSAIEMYNAQKGYDINFTNTLATSIGTIVGGILGSVIAPGMGTIIGAGTGGMLGSGIASILNIDDIKQQKSMNLQNEKYQSWGKQWDEYSIRATDLALRYGGSIGSLGDINDPDSRRSWEGLGYSDLERRQMMTSWSGAAGGKIGDSRSLAEFARMNGLQPGELDSMLRARRTGMDYGTGNVSDYLKHYGLTGANIGEFTGFLSSQGQMAAGQGYLDFEIVNDRLGGLDSIYGEGSRYSNPMAMAGDSINGLNNLTKNTSNPAQFAILAQAYGLGSTTDYTGFQKRRLGGFNTDNLRDVGKTLNNLYGGDQDLIFLALQSLTGSENADWLEQTAGSIASGKMGNLRDEKTFVKSTAGYSTEQLTAAATTARTQNLEIQNIALDVGLKIADAIRTQNQKEISSLAGYLGDEGVLARYLAVMADALRQMASNMGIETIPMKAAHNVVTGVQERGLSVDISPVSDTTGVSDYSFVGKKPFPRDVSKFSPFK